MAKYTAEGLPEAFEEMTLVGLTEFKKIFEEESDVTAAVPVAAAATGAAGGDAAAEEKDGFNVILEDAGVKKISAIKTVREIVSGLGLKGAKGMVESASKAILEGISKDDAEAAKARLEEAGAKVSLR